MACRLNHTIPDLSAPGNQERWATLGKSKAPYRLHAAAAQAAAGGEAPRRNGLVFASDFCRTRSADLSVLTGHEDGVITMNIAEADDVEREKRRVNLHEPYRTLLGHFRHEVGHYYWDRLIAGTARLARFRELFGDETQDYAVALNTYYAQGAPSGLAIPVASAPMRPLIPGRTGAETWAHFLHIVDTIETATSFGMTLRPRHQAARTMTFDPNQVINPQTNFDRIVENWIPLTYALNSLNRGMGLHDLYPFVLSDSAVEKLRFIHQIVQELGNEENSAPEQKKFPP